MLLQDVWTQGVVQKATCRAEMHLSCLPVSDAFAALDAAASCRHKAVTALH